MQSSNNNIEQDGRDAIKEGNEFLEGVKGRGYAELDENQKDKINEIQFKIVKALSSLEKLDERNQDQTQLMQQFDEFNKNLEEFIPPQMLEFSFSNMPKAAVNPEENKKMIQSLVPMDLDYKHDGKLAAEISGMQTEKEKPKQDKKIASKDTSKKQRSLSLSGYGPFFKSREKSGENKENHKKEQKAPSTKLSSRGKGSS